MIYGNTSWQPYRWGDLATLEYGKGLRGYKDNIAKYSVYGTNGHIGWCDEPLVTTPGVIIGRKGAYRGVHYSNAPFFVIDTAFYLSVNYELVDIKWAYYQLLDFDINNIDSGTAIPSTSRDAFYAIPVLLPPLPAQRKIAGILSAYDDLIENNTRRIALLEEMAQLIYREWFVHFRFPGHEGVRMVNSELGPIPEGWEANTLSEFCTLIVGQSPKSEHYNEEGFGLPFHQGVRDFRSRFPLHRVYCTLKKRIAKTGDILFSVRAPVGRINLADKEMIIGRGLHAIRSHVENQLFIYHQLKEIFFRPDMIGGGTIFNSVTKSDMLNIELIRPKAHIEGQFEEIATSISSYIDLLTRKNALLTKTRDLLLPRLISGQLDLSGLEVLYAEYSQ